MLCIICSIYKVHKYLVPAIVLTYNWSMSIEIWVDADSVPTNLRQIILRAAARLCCKCCFVADRELSDVRQFIAENTYSLRQKAREEGETDPEVIRSVRSKIRMDVVSTGENSADDFIVENAPESSLCITHDIPLAARLLEKGCTVIDDRGGKYTKDDIKAKLSDRLVNQELRSWGVYAEQQGKIDSSRQKKFANMLDTTIAHMTTETKEEK